MVTAGISDLKVPERAQQISVKSQKFINATFQPSDGLKDNIVLLTLSKSIKFELYEKGHGDANKICLIRGATFEDKTKVDFYGWTKIGKALFMYTIEKEEVTISSMACKGNKRFNKNQHICLLAQSEKAKKAQPLMGSPVAQKSGRDFLLGFVIESGKNYWIATKIDESTHDWLKTKLE